MRGALTQLGVAIEATADGTQIAVRGLGGRPSTLPDTIDGRSAGTAARFLPFVLALGEDRCVLDGSAQMRARPMSPVLDILKQLGVEAVAVRIAGHLPLEISGTRGSIGGAVRVRADVSSQAISGVLLSAPSFDGGLELVIDGPVVSRPYLDMTVAVMRAFGAEVSATGAGYSARPSSYRGVAYPVEPDASAASYAFASAAITGGRMTVRGLGTESVQGDLAFADLLRRMGCDVEQDANSTAVSGPERLRGIEADMRDCSDTAQTLAVVAAFADSPTRISGIGFIRGKETDRVGAMAAELRRAGVTVAEEPDGLLIQPNADGPQPARLGTYGDHRMAMSLSLLGLRCDGIELEDPACVAKTYPDYFSDLEAWTGASARYSS